MNTIANRTLISDETNNKIKDKAPAVYMRDSDIFPSDGQAALVAPHFIDDETLAVLCEAAEELTNEQVAGLHARFVERREAAMIEEIRQACGLSLIAVDDTAEDGEPDEPAADVLDGTAPLDEAELELADA